MTKYFLGESKFFILCTPHCDFPLCALTNFFSSNQLFSDLFSKCVVFTRFLPNKLSVRVNFRNLLVLPFIRQAWQKFRQINKNTMVYVCFFRFYTFIILLVNLSRNTKGSLINFFRRKFPPLLRSLVTMDG